MNTKTARQTAHVQQHWNEDLTQEQRDELMARHEGRLVRLFTRLGLTARCNECSCLFAPSELEHDENGWGCGVCGSTDVDSPWGNPIRRRDEECAINGPGWSFIRAERKKRWHGE